MQSNIFRSHSDGIPNFSVWGQDVISISRNKIAPASLSRPASDVRLYPSHNLYHCLTLKKSLLLPIAVCLYLAICLWYELEIYLALVKVIFICFYADWTSAACTSEFVFGWQRNETQKPFCSFNYCCASIVKIVRGWNWRWIPQNLPLGTSISNRLSISLGWKKKVKWFLPPSLKNWIL